jgi:hypothetical protein
MNIASTHSADLGPLLSTHRARLSIIMARLVGGAVLAGLGVLILCPIGLIGRTWLLVVAMYCVGTLAGLLLLYSLIPIFTALLDWNQKVDLHGEGIVYRRWFRRVKYRWEEIERVYRRNLDSTIPRWPTIHVPHAFVSHFLLRAISPCVQSFDIDVRGRRFSIDSSVNDFGQLWPIIEEQATQRLLPKAIESFSKGEKLDFGRVQVSSQGVSVRGCPEIPWSEIDYVRVDDSVRFQCKDRPTGYDFGTGVTKVANVLLLVRLLQAIAACPVEDRLK